MPTRIDDKGWDAKDWLFKGMQALAFMFLGNFYVTNIETNKEILKTLSDIRQQMAVEKKEKEFMLKKDEEHDKRFDKLENKVEALEKRTTDYHK